MDTDMDIFLTNATERDCGQMALGETRDMQYSDDVAADCQPVISALSLIYFAKIDF